MQENKDLKPSKEEKNLVLIVENANTELKRILTDAFMNGWNKQLVKSKVDALIDETLTLLNEAEATDDLIKSTEIGLKQTFLREWRETTTLIKEKAKSDKTGILALTLARMLNTETPMKIVDNGGIIIGFTENDVAIASGGVTNLRDFMTEVENAAANRFVDYASLVEDAIVDVTEKIADGSLSATAIRHNPNGTTSVVHKSIRNMAEIETRYQLIVDDIKRQGLELNKDYVVASSHPNASERCSWWQGKLFLLDIDVASRTMGQYKAGTTPKQDILEYKDGKPVYSLKQACEQGFLSFNCQHRLVKYYKGINPPKYDLVTVNKDRALTTRQRVLENRIRKYKARAEMSQSGVHQKFTDPFTGKRRVMSQKTYNEKMSKYWQEKYKELAINNDLPIYIWRTRITLTEREMRNL